MAGSVRSPSGLIIAATLISVRLGTSPHDLVIIRACQDRSARRAVFLRTFFKKSLEEGQKARTFAFDLAGTTFGMVKCDDVAERGFELLSSAGIFTVHGIGIATPAPGDFADWQSVVESKPK